MSGDPARQMNTHPQGDQELVKLFSTVRCCYDLLPHA